MAYIRIEDYNRFKQSIYLHINDCIDHYRHKDIMHLPAYHGCNTVNRKALENLLTTEEDISAFNQQIKDIGGKRKRSTE